MFSFCQRKLLGIMTNSVGISTSSAQIVIAKYHFTLKVPEVLEEVAVSRFTAESIPHDPGIFYH